MNVVVDTSVILKWFHTENETEVAESQAILAAHRDEILTAQVLDLCVYELGNILIRALKWSPEDTADQLDDLMLICGPPLTPAPQWRRDAAALAHRHGLTFYGALFAAAAQALDVSLISMDRQLLVADLAETPAIFTARVGLTP